jgi:hypothetical protein
MLAGLDRALPMVDFSPFAMVPTVESRQTDQAPSTQPGMLRAAVNAPVLPSVSPASPSTTPEANRPAALKEQTQPGPILPLQSSGWGSALGRSGTTATAQTASHTAAGTPDALGHHHTSTLPASVELPPGQDVPAPPLALLNSLTTEWLATPAPPARQPAPDVAAVQALPLHTGLQTGNLSAAVGRRDPGPPVPHQVPAMSDQTAAVAGATVLQQSLTLIAALADDWRRASGAPGAAGTVRAAEPVMPGPPTGRPAVRSDPQPLQSFGAAGSKNTLGHAFAGTASAPARSAELLLPVTPEEHQPDARLLAMLISDVLVEEARRHGVDLS